MQWVSHFQLNGVNIIFGFRLRAGVALEVVLLAIS
jgi:hypothetical protein